MGFSHSWIAVQGLKQEQVLEALGMEVSDVQTDFLDGTALIDWKDDWLLVISDDGRDAFEAYLADLAPLGRAAVVCGIHEGVMYSEARGYEAGKEIWGFTLSESDPDESQYRSLNRIGAVPARRRDPHREVDLASSRGCSAGFEG